MIRVVDIRIRKSQRVVYVPRRVVRTSRGVFRVFLSVQKQMTAGALAVVFILTQASAFIAFEAHIVNVTAELVQIDPPVITPDSLTFNTPFDSSIDDADPDATHIFYSIGAGSLDPDTVPDPACGDPNGGPKPVGPIPVGAVDTVIKAIACDGPSAAAHGSLIVYEIYDFVQPYGTIQGHKYHDLDQDAIFDIGLDFPIQGWQVTIFDGGATTTTVTDPNGFYEFTNLIPGVYTIREESRDGWVHVTPKQYSITIDSTETETVDFYNFDTGFACIPLDVNFPSNLAVQAGGSGTELNDDVALAANVEINGDVRSNDDIEIIGGGTNRDIFGSATSSDQTDDIGIQISKLVLEGAPTASLPDIMIDEWKNRARDGGTVMGSFIFPNNTTGLIMGPTEILGNVTFGSSNGVTIKGPIYIHGNLTIGSGSDIFQDPAFGNQFTTIIVDGIIDISSNITFSGSGALGTFLLISTRQAVAGNGAAILTNSNNSDLGDVVLYASAGDVHIDSNRTLLAIFATHGTGTDADDNAAVRLDSNVTVNWRTLPDTISCGPRQPFESTSHILINEFLPNSTSTPEQGAAGAPLDGEWIELFNPTAVPTDVTGWHIYDETITNEIVIGASNTKGSLTIPSLGYLVVYSDGDSDFALNNSGGDTARLFTGAIGGGGVLVDSHTYTVGAPEGKSFARIPDGAANWIDPDPTPGEPNTYFFEPLDGFATMLPFISHAPDMMLPPREIPEMPDTAGTENAAEELLEKVQKVKVEEPAPLDVPPAPEGPDDAPDEEDIVIEIDHISDTTLTDESVMASETLPAPEMPTPLENETVEPALPDASETPLPPPETPTPVESSPSETVE